MAQIFVSYKREDLSEDFIQHLRSKLEGAGFDVWIDKELLLPGQDWKKEIDNAIKASVGLIVIMTPNARQSEYVTYEWAFAVGRGLPVIPIMLKQTDLHPRLNDVQYIDFTNAWGNADSNWNKLLMSLNIEVARNDKEKIPNAIARAIQDLDSSDERQRSGALETLRNSYPHPSAKMGLINALSHVTTDVRQISIQLLEKLEDKDSAIYIVECLNDASLKVKETAINALIQLNIDITIPFLINVFDDVEIKIPIIKALTEMQAKDAIPIFIENIESSDEEIKILLIESLVKLDAKDAIPIFMKLLESNRTQSPLSNGLINALGKLKAKEVSTLMIELLQEGNSHPILTYFAQVKTIEALPQIIKRLYSKNDLVRLSAIDIIVQYNDNSAIEPLGKILEQKVDRSKPARFNFSGNHNEVNTSIEGAITVLGKMEHFGANELSLSKIGELKEIDKYISFTSINLGFNIENIIDRLKKDGSEYVKHSLEKQYPSDNKFVF